ncbi:type II secretion system F family protein [Halostreptopolyspora alba]
MLLITVSMLVTGVFFVLAAREWGIGSDQDHMLASRSALEKAERRANSPFSRFDSWLRRTDIGKNLERRLNRAGMRIPVALFATIILAVGAISTFFVGRLLTPAFGFLSAFLVIGLFISYLNRQEERRREAFISQLPELARVLSNATSAGLALPTAITMAAEELDDPAGSELHKASQQMRLGQSFDSTIAELRERMPSREIGVLISTLLIASRSGGALVTALQSISDTLEARKETRREVKTILGETTGTAWAMLVIGVGSLFLINTLNPGVVERMTQSIVGVAILIIAGFLFVVGFFAVRRITKIDF